MQLVAVEVVGPLGIALAQEQDAKVDALGERVEERDPVRSRDLGEERDARQALRCAVANRNQPRRLRTASCGARGITRASGCRMREGSGIASPI